MAYGKCVVSGRTLLSRLTILGGIGVIQHRITAQTSHNETLEVLLTLDRLLPKIEEEEQNSRLS